MELQPANQRACRHMGYLENLNSSHHTPVVLGYLSGLGGGYRLLRVLSKKFISHEDFVLLHESGTKRYRILDQGCLHRWGERGIWTVQFPFRETIGDIFEAETSVSLRRAKSGRFWAKIDDNQRMKVAIFEKKISKGCLFKDASRFVYLYRFNETKSRRRANKDRSTLQPGKVSP